ncbi:hypothetical protein DFH28DRAFT_1093728 [Melampsora americana]|nr:hypothetical protein DFH28DRAFT_1093728 [Melampsora americana]
MRPYSQMINDDKRPSPTLKKKVIIIGAGVGGLATAARLASAGLDVTVVEKNSFSGGRCSLIEKDGFRFDRGPILYLMPELFDDLFDDLNEKVKDWYELKKCEPNYVLHYHDKEKFTLTTDMPKMKSEIERFEGKDGWARFLCFLVEGQIHYEAFMKHVLLENIASLMSISKLGLAILAIKLHVFDKQFRRASSYFWTERLRRAFTFSSMYLGMSPYNAPATYNLLQYTELAQGIWYPKGGLHALPRSLESIAEKKGAKFIYSSPVKQIITTQRKPFKATGIELESGQILRADAVISNADLLWTYENLLPPSSFSKKSTQNSKLTCSSISFYWAIKRKLPSLVIHQVFLPKDFRASFDTIFDSHLMPDQPSFYVNVSSRIDPTAAPPGKDSMIVMVPLGHLDESNSKLDWNQVISSAREFVINTLEENILQPGDLQPGERFSDLIEFEILNTPHTWQKDLNLFKGSMLGLSHDILQAVNFRSRIRHSTIDGMYFVGDSTHPATGVPVVACGSKFTSEAILKDLNINIPWSNIPRSDRPPHSGAIRKSQSSINHERAKDLNKLFKPFFLEFEGIIIQHSLLIIFLFAITYLSYGHQIISYFSS